MPNAAASASTVPPLLDPAASRYTTLPRLAMQAFNVIKSVNGRAGSSRVAWAAVSCGPSSPITRHVRP
jgi:hypothetical protein